MVKNNIVLDDDIKACEDLFLELNRILNAYAVLPVLEEIHSNSGNRLLSTSNSCSRDKLFAEAFNNAIIEYVTKPGHTNEDEA